MKSKFFSYLFIGTLVLMTACTETPGDDPEKDKEQEQEQPTGPFAPPVLSEDTACALTGFSIGYADNQGLGGNSITFTLNSATNTYTAERLRWITGDEPDKLVARFTFDSPDARLYLDEMPIVSGETALSYADNVVLTVWAGNAVNKKEYTVSLVCPQINTELPVLHFTEVASADVTSKSVYAKSRLVMYSNVEGEEGVGEWDETDDQVEIRVRGNSTSNWAKKPYRMKLPSKFSPIGLNHAKEKSWVLLANDIDKSQIRNHIAFGFSRVLFDPAASPLYHEAKAMLFTPCSKFVNVYMKGDYMGIYQMSDQLEVKPGRMAIEELTDQSPSEDVSGGYMIENYIHNDEDNTWTTSRGYMFNMGYPDSEEFKDEQYTYIKDFVQSTENTIYSGSLTDPTTGWRRWIDEKTLVDYVIVRELAGDMDGYTSVYFYKRRGVDKLFMGPIWDSDKGFDNEKRNTKPNDLMIKAGFHMNHNADDWFNRIWDNDAAFRAAVNARWQAKKAELRAVAIKALDELPTAMAKSLEANFDFASSVNDAAGSAAPWSWFWQEDENAPIPPTSQTYAGHIGTMRTWLDNRITILDREFAK